MTEPRPLLTADEHAVIELCAVISRTIGRVVGNGSTRAPDLHELTHHIHAIQRAVGAQAAARAYPDRFRLLGETLPEEPAR